MAPVTRPAAPLSAAPAEGVPAARRGPPWHLLGLAGVLLLTVLLRFPLLTTIPVGLHYDEAWSGIDAASVTWSHHPVFFTDSNGMEPLYLYIQTISIALFGRTPFALRVVSAVLGTLTVPALYLLVRAIAGRSAGLFAAAVLAVTYWHVHVSRLGYRAIALPLVECLAWWALWQGVTRRDWRWLALGGGFVGVSLYTYSTARAFPVAIALWLLWLAIRERHWRRLAELVLVGAAAVVVFFPLGWYFLQHPEEFINRVGQVVVLSPEVADTGRGSVLTGIIRTLGMFSIHGDPQWKYNLSGKPTFDPVMSVGFYLGIAVCLWRALVPGRVTVALAKPSPQKAEGVSDGGAGAALLLIWFVVMLVPGFVTTDPPETLHTLATVPAVCAFPALGFLALWRWLQGRWPRLIRAGAPLAGALILAEGITTAASYFVVWAPNTQTYYWLHGDVADVARRLKQVPSTTQLYVATQYLHHPTVVFLAPQAAARATWFDATRSFPMHAGAGPSIYVFAHGYDILPAAQSALHDAQLSAPRDRDGGVIYHWYALAGPPRPPALQLPLNVPLGQDVVLEGVTVSPVSTTGQRQSVQVTLRWRVPRPPSRKLSLFVHLLDASGYRWAQEDGLGYFSDDWQPGDDVVTTEHVTLPPGVPPAPLVVSADLYDVQTGTVLPFPRGPGAAAAADGGLIVGQVTPGATAAAGVTTIPGSRPPMNVAPGLSLLGAVLPAESVKAGDPFTVVLYVKKTAAGAVPDPALSLSNAGATDSEPVPESALLSQLPEGSILALRHVVLVSPRAPTADVTLRLQAADSAALTLGTVHIVALPRAYAAPSPQHPLNVRFGAVAELVGYDLSPGTPVPGGELTVTLYWRSLGTPEHGYTVFTHLVSADGHLHGQHDGPPASGHWPTTSWLPGQIVSDSHVLHVDATASGSLTLQVGLYDASGTRLPATGPAGQAGDTYAVLTLTPTPLPKGAGQG